MVRVECELCDVDGTAEELLICESCGRAYHNYCLIPPLPNIPRRSWRCAECIAKVCYVNRSNICPHKQEHYTVILKTELVRLSLSSAFGSIKIIKET